MFCPNDSSIDRPSLSIHLRRSADAGARGCDCSTASRIGRDCFVGTVVGGTVLAGSHRFDGRDIARRNAGLEGERIGTYSPPLGRWGKLVVKWWESAMPRCVASQPARAGLMCCAVPTNASLERVGEAEKLLRRAGLEGLVCFQKAGLIPGDARSAWLQSGP